MSRIWIPGQALCGSTIAVFSQYGIKHGDDYAEIAHLVSCTYVSWH